LKEPAADGFFSSIRQFLAQTSAKISPPPKQKNPDYVPGVRQKQKERQTDRHSDRQSGRHTDRQRDIHTNKHTATEEKKRDRKRETARCLESDRHREN